MRIKITDYKDKDIMINIKDWFVEQEEIDYHEALFMQETDKAIHLCFGDKFVWVPKSLIKIIDTEKQTQLYKSKE